jgi:predicted unusual protein kinase regulating ubiquinone biosynthesis (AarF/ABC1/UbiB family)
MAVAFGRPADEVFSYISPRPVAAASLGQVYRAQLRPQFGEGEVAVKVQRPDVLEQVRPRVTTYCMVDRWIGLTELWRLLVWLLCW